MGMKMANSSPTTTQAANPPNTATSCREREKGNNDP